MKTAVTDFWNQFLLTQATQFLQTQSDRKLPATCNAWAFGNTPEMMDELSGLVLRGSKRATTSLAWIYEHFPNEKRPEVGDLSVVLNSSGDPVCIIENVSVTKRTFGEIDETYARAEGEGDLSLAYWQKVHWEFFAGECQTIGRAPSFEMEVICEIFKLVYPGESQCVSS
jgi:uncharacterized protein YhfF